LSGPRQHLWKTRDKPVLGDKPGISPKTVSDGERMPPEILKIKNSRDTNVFFGKDPYWKSFKTTPGQK
jgi:hypothetical protein